MKILKLKTKELVLCAFFVALIAVGSFVKVPIFGIPFTLQLFFVMLAAQILGSRLSAFVLISYIILGLIGFPIFSGGGGISYIFSPTFGYIIGFLLSAPVMGCISHKGEISFKKSLFANLLGYVIIYICGISYYLLITVCYFGQAADVTYILIFCFVIFMPSDMLFCFLSVFAACRLEKIIKM